MFFDIVFMYFSASERRYVESECFVWLHRGNYCILLERDRMSRVCWVRRENSLINFVGSSAVRLIQVYFCGNIVSPSVDIFSNNLVTRNKQTLGRLLVRWVDN